MNFKPDKTILANITSTDQNLNLKAINKLRDKGKPEYLPFLIDLANSSKHETVIDNIFNLLNQIKDKNAVPYIIEAIQSKTNKLIQKQLVEACWQNGLNYAQFLPVFIDLIIHGSDEISFEAFTVVENLEYLPGDSVVLKEIKKIEKHIADANTTRKYFLDETIKIISNQLE